MCLDELNYSDLSAISQRSVMVTTNDGERLRSRMIIVERYTESVETTVDNNGGYGFELSRRRFLDTKYERWKLVRFVG